MVREETVEGARVVWGTVAAHQVVITVGRRGRVEVDHSGVPFSALLETVWSRGAGQRGSTRLSGVNQTSFFTSGLHVTFHLSSVLRSRSIWRPVEWAIPGPSPGLALSLDSLAPRGIWRRHVPLPTRSAGAVVTGSNLISPPLAVHHLAPPQPGGNLGPEWGLPVRKVQQLSFHSSVLLCTPSWKRMACLLSGELCLPLESVDD